jgi:NAD(P)-dependent dehydrogenase (short-subunit alcohol dehydrogenase family)
MPTASAYTVSKAAVHALTRSIVVEIDRERYPDVLVNEFLPGIVRTAMSDTGIAAADVYPHAKFVASLPRGGPTGQIFLQSTLYVEDTRRFGRVRRVLRRVKDSLSRAR